MRKFLVSVVLLPLLSACAPTMSSIEEYDAEGNLVRRISTSESVVKTLMKATENKTLIVWDNSWLAGITATMSTLEDPTPTVKILFGSNDKGMISLHPNHRIESVAKFLPEMRKGELSLGASGVVSKRQEPKKE